MPRKKMPQLMVVSPSSGVGKTMVAVGLMSFLRGKGYEVQPFKCGPDYIDTKFHEAACGRGSVNLDLFMAPGRHLRDLYGYYCRDASAAVAEGMMGMLDGFSLYKGSSAQVAECLGLPLLMVVDASRSGFSVCLLLSGFREYCRESGSTMLGVIFNKVGSDRHKEMLREAAERSGVKCLGLIPRDMDLERDSRYLGLDFSGGSLRTDVLSEIIERHVDWQNIIKMSSMECPKWSDPFDRSVPFLEDFRGKRIAVARNSESFSFIYREHLDLLDRLGDLAFFDPEQNEPLPSGTSLLYIPGGYPERHVSSLSSSTVSLSSIRDYASNGGRIVAECGGMMYLCKEIETDDGSFPMSGILPYKIKAGTRDRHLSLGYRQLRLDGNTYRGHEFHYTQFADPTQVSSACQVYDAKGRPVSSPIIITKGIMASYTHLYWYSWEMDLHDSSLST